jgi:hypothetical protein
MQKRNALYEVESTKGITDASGEQVEEWESGDKFRFTEEAWATHYKEDRNVSTQYVVSSIMLHRDDPNDMSLLCYDENNEADPWLWVPIIDVERVHATV